MTRIAYVINYIVKNGPSRVVLNLINNLDKERYDITLITLFLGNDLEVIDNLRNTGVTVYECSTLSRMKCILGQCHEFDAVITNGHFDILHTHGLIPDLLSSRLDNSIRKITTIHNNISEDYLETYGWIKSRIYISMHLSALKKIDVCVCCSESVYLSMKDKLRNSMYIQNGIEPVQAHSVVTRNELDIPEKSRVFLYCGVLNQRKNVVWLIDNFSRCHNEHEYLIILGEGKLQEECIKKADSHVRMLGFKSDPISYMKISDVYMSASKSEGFSISILEALSCGLALFLSDIPSHREVISAGEDVPVGLLFNIIDMNNSFSNIRKLHFSKDAISQFQKSYMSAALMTSRYDNVYQDIEDLR